MATLIRCDLVNCFANWLGSRCRALDRHCDDEAGNCKFFKTVEQNELEQIEAYQRLKQLGRTDLIELQDHTRRASLFT